MTTPIRTIWLAAVGVLVLASCSELTPPDSRKQAENRWCQMRARLKCQLAAEHLSKGRLSEAVAHIEAAVELDPDTPAAYVLMTRILLERGETASAVKTLAEAVAHGGETGETNYLSGLIAERYGRFDDALMRYEEAVRKDPTNAHYVVTVAETLVTLGRVSDALAMVEERWTDFEQNATLRWLAGEIHMMTGRYDQAAEAFRQACVIAPDDALLQVQLGLALTFAERYAEGRQILSAAVSAGQEASAPVLMALGRCHLRQGAYEEAKQVLRRATELEPDNAAGWCLLSQAALGSDDLLTSRRAATRAMQIAPAQSDYAVLLAYICWRQQDHAAAVGTLEGILRDAPDDLLALYLLSRCHEAKGDEQAARACYERALRVAPDCEWARQRIEDSSARAGGSGGGWPIPQVAARSP